MNRAAEPDAAPTLIDPTSLEDGLHWLTADEGIHLSLFVFEGRLTNVSIHQFESVDEIKVFTQDTLHKKKVLRDETDDCHAYGVTTLRVRSDA